MQISRGTPPRDSFDSRGPSLSRPPLTSEIVRLVFQRNSGHDDGYSCQEEDTMWSDKRVFSLNSLYAYSPQKRVSSPLPSSAFATFSHSSESKESRSSTLYLKPDLNVASKSTSGKESTKYVDTVQKPKIKQIRRKTQRRREQCRTNQARYRMKQMKHAVILEETVQSLRVEIPALDMQRNRLLYGSKQSIWSVVVEYAHIFRFGVPVASKPLPTYPSMKSFQDTDTKRQLAFLRSTMSDDLILCELRGVNALMDQWRRYASSFQDLYFQLECIQGLSEKFVTGLASLSVTITETTLATVFPHLFGSGRVQEDLGYDAKLEPWRAEILASKLLGQRLRLPCSLCFEWDVESSRVMRLEMTVGFLTPLLQVLGRLEDAAAVMEHALITPCGAIDINGESNSWGHIE